MPGQTQGALIHKQSVNFPEKGRPIQLCYTKSPTAYSVARYCRIITEKMSGAC